MTEKTVLRKELGKAAKGKQFIVMNNADDDFPKGTVVTCMDRYGERFNSESETDTYMYSDVLLKPVNSTLTFTELAAKLSDLEVGTEFKTDYGSILYVGNQQNLVNEDNKFLYWKSSDKPVGVAEVTVGATYTEIQKEPAKPEFTEIDWKEAFQIVADGGIVYADDKIAVSKYTDFGDINSSSGDYIADDFDDLLNDTNWFKKTE